MTTVHDVEPEKLINAISKDFKGKEEFKAPEWTKWVKLGRHKEKPPMNRDWWSTRLAAVLRAVSVKGPIGIEKLRTKYGGRKKFSRKPKRFVKASGNVIRKLMQQLETTGLVEKDKNKKGRIITKKGQSMLDKTAARLVKEEKKK